MQPKIIFTIIIFLFTVHFTFGQAATLSRIEQQRRNKLFNMCTYVQKTYFKDLNQEKLFRKYVAHYSFPEDSTTTIHPQRKEMFSRLLKRLDSTLDTLHIKDFDAVPWNKFAYPQNLPHMLWEAEPLTHLFGRPLPVHDYSKTVAKGKKQLENAFVVFKKDKPDVPQYFILFDENDKIISWFLLNQGGLHYFLPF